MFPVEHFLASGDLEKSAFSLKEEMFLVGPLEVLMAHEKWVLLHNAQFVGCSRKYLP